MTEKNVQMEKTKELLSKIAAKYQLKNLAGILANDSSILYKKDIYICLENIVAATLAQGPVLEQLKAAKNLYNSPVFAINAKKDEFRIVNPPDFEKAIDDLAKYKAVFRLSPYSILNTYLAIVEAEIAGFDLDELYNKGIEHIEESIKESLKSNPNWNKNTLNSLKPKLLIPVGAAGSGKSTFYRELSNVVNISCDNVRYLLFNSFGPCFASWESALSWWVVNQLTDHYISKGYSVFYNGVNTDLEYRSPVTMENTDPLYAGMPYDIKMVYFEPPAKLSAQELIELKAINLWQMPVDKVEISSLSPNVATIIELVRNNYQRTLTRTQEIAAGTKKQDPFDVLYSVPAPIVKLFVEQSFDQPKGSNVTVVPRKEIPDAALRAAFYKKYAEEALK